MVGRADPTATTLPGDTWQLVSMVVELHSIG